MADVRVDSQGIPKAPVYETTPPVLHRGPLTGPDTSDPTQAAQGLDCTGYRMVRFDLDTTGSTGLTLLGVRLMLWNPKAQRFFGGAARRFQEQELAHNPCPSLEAEVRGGVVFLKVEEAQAQSLSLRIYASLS